MAGGAHLLNEGVLEVSSTYISVVVVHRAPLTCVFSESANKRPAFVDIVHRLSSMIDGEKGGRAKKNQSSIRRITGIIDRHSTWF